MIRELELHRKSPLTVDAYVRAVARLAQHFGRSPDAISVEEVRDFFHHLITQEKAAFSTCNQKLAAIKFFYRHVLGQKDFSLHIPAKRSGRLPEPFSRGEIAKILHDTRDLKHRALLMTAYGGGLRVSELVHLRPQDIHSQRMLIRVNQGKGRRDRYTLLSQRLLEELRTYWRAYRPQHWLFPGRDVTRPLPAQTAEKIFRQAKERAGIQHGHGIHSLRHSFATHLMEAGVPLPVIQRLMGHASLTTTAKYLHVTSQHLAGVRSPLDLLRLPQDSDVLVLQDIDVVVPQDSGVPVPTDPDVPASEDSGVPVSQDSDVPVPEDSGAPVPKGSDPVLPKDCAIAG
jgi:site-specific recombinase XerD